MALQKRSPPENRTTSKDQQATSHDAEKGPTQSSKTISVVRRGEGLTNNSMHLNGLLDRSARCDTRWMSIPFGIINGIPCDIYLSVYESLGCNPQTLKELRQVVYTYYEEKARVQPTKVYTYDYRASTFEDGSARRRDAWHTQTNNTNLYVFYFL